MEDKIDTVEYKGYEINIYLDDMPLDPIKDWDFLGTITCWHSRYSIGHDHKFDTPDEFEKELAMEADSTVEQRIEYWEDGKGWAYLDRKNPETSIGVSDEKVNQLVKAIIEKHYIMLSVYLYNHSGITIRTYPFGDRWDSGQIGYVYVSKEKVRKDFGWKNLTKARIDKVKDQLIAEIKIYDQFLRGDIYGFKTVDPITDEVIDSCWGFFGYDFEENGLLDHARGEIDGHLEQLQEDRAMAYAEEIGEVQF